MDRSYLFAPGHNAKLLGRVFEAGADAVILDLEDAVAPEQKGLARDHLADRLPGFGRAHLSRTLVRINAAGTPWCEEDLR